MKKIVCVFFACLFVCCVGCKKEQKEINQKEVTIKESKSISVYLTKTGKCYHTQDCYCLKKSKIKKTLYEVCNNYSPCQICYPPVIEE